MNLAQRIRRPAYAEKIWTVALVVLTVLALSALLGQRASLLWLGLLCAVLAIVAMARHPILGTRCRDRHSYADPIRVGHGPGSQPESYSFTDTSHICAMVPDHGATP